MTTSKVFVSRKLLPRFLFRILTLNKVKLLKNKVYFLQTHNKEVDISQTCKCKSSVERKIDLFW